MWDLNSREISVLFWTTVLVTAALSVESARSSVWKVVKAALFSKLALVWVSLGAYSALLIVCLQRMGVWDRELAKETLIWFAFSAVAYPFQFHDPQKEPRVFRALIRDSLSVLIIVEILVDAYTFSLPVELLIIPLVTLIALMGAAAETREEHRPVAKMLANIQAIIGFTLVAVVIRRAINDPDRSFLDGVVPALTVVVLSLACWPYIYLLRLFFAHDGMLWRIGWKRKVSKPFKHYAALRILWHVRFRTTAVNPFIRRNAFKLDEVIDRGTLAKFLAEDAGDR